MRAQIVERKAEILTHLRQRLSPQRFLHRRSNRARRQIPRRCPSPKNGSGSLEQLEPESAVYNICRAMRVHGVFDIAALEASFNAIVIRHETLRTAFRLSDGKAGSGRSANQNISNRFY